MWHDGEIYTQKCTRQFFLFTYDDGWGCGATQRMAGWCNMDDGRRLVVQCDVDDVVSFARPRKRFGVRS